MNGNILQIKEYNTQDSYVRGHVQVDDIKDLVAYSGVLQHVKKIDSHDHQTLWLAFPDSGRKPYLAKKSELPKWWVNNPIRERKFLLKDYRESNTQQRIRNILADDNCPYLQKEDYSLMIREAQHGNFRAVWGLTISGYSEEAAAALKDICWRIRTKRLYATMPRWVLVTISLK